MKLGRRKLSEHTDQRLEGRPILAFLWGLLLAALYLALCLEDAETTGGKIRFGSHGAPPPCMPPQVGDFPDCHDPERK